MEARGASIIPFPAHRVGPAVESNEARLTKRELAAVLSVSEKTIERWQGRTYDPLPKEPWGQRLVRYRLSRVLAWRSRQRM